MRCVRCFSCGFRLYVFPCPFCLKAYGFLRPGQELTIFVCSLSSALPPARITKLDDETLKAQLRTVASGAYKVLLFGSHFLVFAVLASVISNPVDVATICMANLLDLR